MSMLFKTPLCPTCQSEPEGTLEVVYGIAQVSKVEGSDEFEYTGQTDIDWDSQKTVECEDPKCVTLQCLEGHRWESEVEHL